MATSSFAEVQPSCRPTWARFHGSLQALECGHPRGSGQHELVAANQTPRQDADGRANMSFAGKRHPTALPLQHQRQIQLTSDLVPETRNAGFTSARLAFSNCLGEKLQVAQLHEHVCAQRGAPDSHCLQTTLLRLALLSRPHKPWVCDCVRGGGMVPGTFQHNLGGGGLSRNLLRTV